MPMATCRSSKKRVYVCVLSDNMVIVAVGISASLVGMAVVEFVEAYLAGKVVPPFKVEIMCDTLSKLYECKTVSAWHLLYQLWVPARCDIEEQMEDIVFHGAIVVAPVSKQHSKYGP